MNVKLKIEELENEVIFLRQTLREDFEDLYIQGGHQIIWEQHSEKGRYKKDKFLEYFNSGIKNEFGSLTIINKNNNKIVGWTRLYDFKEEDLSVKLGYTFLGKDYWGSNINYNVKKLILDYVFSFLNTVYFDVYEKNIRSQKSVMKLGGILNKINSNKHEYILTKKEWSKWDSN
jgi:RimJ/RimL family protein N-acetyltransferase